MQQNEDKLLITYGDGDDPYEQEMMLRDEGKMIIRGDDSDDETLYPALCISEHVTVHPFMNVVEKVECVRDKDDEEICGYYGEPYLPKLSVTIKPRDKLSKECSDIIESCIDFLLYKRVHFEERLFPNLEKYITKYLKIDEEYEYDIPGLICHILIHYKIGEYGVSMRTMWLDHSLYKDRQLDQQTENSIAKWLETEK